MIHSQGPVKGTEPWGEEELGFGQLMTRPCLPPKRGGGGDGLPDQAAVAVVEGDVRSLGDLL